MQTMHSEQGSAAKRTDEHLNHLRETMHKLANDMVGVSQLSGITHSDVKELKLKQVADMLEVHGHIERETKQLEKKIEAVSVQVAAIKPRAESYGRLIDITTGAVMKTLVGLAFIAIAYIIGMGE